MVGVGISHRCFLFPVPCQDDFPLICIFLGIQAPHFGPLACTEVFKGS